MWKIREWLKEGCVVIDVGINAIPDSTKKSGYTTVAQILKFLLCMLFCLLISYRLVGDVDKEALSVASKATPVPGGVGPMTVLLITSYLWMMKSWESHSFTSLLFWQVAMLLENTLLAHGMQTTTKAEGGVWCIGWNALRSQFFFSLLYLLLYVFHQTTFVLAAGAPVLCYVLQVIRIINVLLINCLGVADQ